MTEREQKRQQEDPASQQADAVIQQGPLGLSRALLQRKLARRLAQRKADAVEHPSEVAGPSGPGRTLPEDVRAKMEGSLGADFSAVRVHEGPQAHAMGAVAYAQGTDVHFAPGQYDPHSQPGQELLGHELAHVVQQGQGRVQATAQAKDVSINDDHSLESEADDLGRRAARGEPARGASASPAGAGIQRYADATLAGKPWRVADDLHIAIRQDSPVYGSHFFYADAGLIKSSSDTLQAQKSNLKLAAGGDTQEVASADGKTKKTLSRVVPTNTDDKSTGNKKPGGMNWPDDCGEAANSVMQGPGRGGKAVFSGPPEGFIEKIIAAITGSTKFERETKESSYGGDTMTHRGATLYSPHILLDEIFKAAMNDKDADKAWKKYQALPKPDKEKFDQQVGINKYAQPEVGEAYSIVSNKDDFVEGKSAWNFHWGGVVMRSGGDSVTMENFAGSGADAWDFQLYGPPSKLGQTFHEQQESRSHSGTAEYGASPTTIRVRGAT